MTPVIAITIALATATPSASTLAAVAIFAANVDRKWPADEREPAVTVEALRLMAEATRSMADDWKIDDNDLRDAIAGFNAAREQLSRLPRGDQKRRVALDDALARGQTMINRLVDARGLDDADAQLSALKKSIDRFDDDQPVRQQVDVLAEYFQHAGKLLKSIVDH